MATADDKLEKLQAAKVRLEAARNRKTVLTKFNNRFTFFTDGTTAELFPQNLSDEFLSKGLAWADRELADANAAFAALGDQP